MAPFKLKFRMGSSRSTSQEVDPDPQVNEALLNHQSMTIGASNSTIDSADCNSLGSLGNNSERKSLLPNKTNALRLGYLNPNIKQCATSDSNSSSSSSPVPKSPPPSYEHVLEENTRLANSFDLGSRLTLSNEDGSTNSQLQKQLSSASLLLVTGSDQYHPLQTKNTKVNLSNNLPRKNSNLTLCDRISLSNLCTDPDCSEVNLDRRDNHRGISQLHLSTTTITASGNRSDENDNNNENDINAEIEERRGGRGGSHKELSSLGDSRELLISTKMNAATAATAGAAAATSSGSALDNCNSSDCQHRCTNSSDGSMSSNNYDFCDPLMNQEEYCTDELCTEDHYNNDGNQENHHQPPPPEYSENPNACVDLQANSDSESDDDGCWDTNQMSGGYQQQQQIDTSPMTTEIISNKSSKEIYKALAKQMGINCKMSDTCRCMDCQSRYFDCEYDENDQQDIDGGLGAGTPMFISEVMHGSVCNIL